MIYRMTGKQDNNMKIAESRIRRIIKEELNSILSEQSNETKVIELRCPLIGDNGLFWFQDDQHLEGGSTVTFKVSAPANTLDYPEDPPGCGMPFIAVDGYSARVGNINNVRTATHREVKKIQSMTAGRWPFPGGKDRWLFLVPASGFKIDVPSQSVMEFKIKRRNEGAVAPIMVAWACAPCEDVELPPDSTKVEDPELYGKGS